MSYVVSNTVLAAIIIIQFLLMLILLFILMIFGNCELNIKLEYVVPKKIHTPHGGN